MAIAWWFLFLILVITSSHIAAEPYRTNKIYYVPVTNLQIPISENEKWGSGGCDAILALWWHERDGVTLDVGEFYVDPQRNDKMGTFIWNCAVFGWIYHSDCD